jgi:hypothetical protein
MRERERERERENEKEERRMKKAANVFIINKAYS